MARAHNSALHSACPDVGPALTSSVWGGGSGRTPLRWCCVDSSYGQKRLGLAMLGKSFSDSFTSVGHGFVTSPGCTSRGISFWKPQLRAL